jgi:hypothetical protein
MKAMSYNPQRWLEERYAEAQAVAELLGPEWVADGAVVKHSNGSVGLMIRGIAVRFDNSIRTPIPEDASPEQIAAILTEVAK